MKNPIKINFKTEIFPLSLIMLTIAASYYFFRHFGEQVPVHWNIAGQADNWSGPAEAAFVIPAVLIFMYVMFLFLPLLDPKKERYAEFEKTYRTFRNVIILFMTFIYFISSLNGLGYYLPVDIYIPGAVGVLFVIIGNYMSKIKTNWFLGIRTPWTLSSEEVWNKTHRLGGKLFIVSGALMITEGFLPIKFRLFVFVSIMVIMILGTIGSSYYFYNQEQKTKK